MAKEDSLKATPRNKLLGMIADALSWTTSPQATQQMQNIADFIGVPAAASVVNDMSYGAPLTSGKGMTTKMRPATEELVTNLLSNISPPAKATVGAAGIVAGGAKAAEALGIEKIVARALDMVMAGKSDWAIGVESEKALRAARNPGKALSVFIGPDGQPRIYIDNAAGQLAPSLLREFSRSRRGPGYVNLPKRLQPQKDTDWVGPEVMLSDLYLHPSLYALDPIAATTKVRSNIVYDMTGTSGGYSPSGNVIELPTRLYGDSTTRDPIEALVNTFSHEGTHALQYGAGLRTGGSPSVDSVKESIQQAKTMGSYRSPEQLAQLEQQVQDIENLADDSPMKRAMLQKLYMNNYGEWEARLGSTYGRSLPKSNERKLTY